MKISFIGKFGKLYDEEYIARSFEMLGHDVQRLPEKLITHQFQGLIEEFQPDFVLMTKFFVSQPREMMQWFKEKKIKTVSWIFDLYWDYDREERIPRTPGFKADKVFTTDGGHDKNWSRVGIEHHLVRQGIYTEECVLLPQTKAPHGIAFVGSFNSLYAYRQMVMQELKKSYAIKWIGSNNTDEMRGMDLNQLYADTKIIIGDSVYSPYYWSNRVVETLGRGGFLIHQEVPGLKEEYPYLVTYKTGDIEDLKSKIDYYLNHEEERREIVKLNFEWVRSKYTMEKKCAELISYL